VDKPAFAGAEPVSTGRAGLSGTWTILKYVQQRRGRGMAVAKVRGMKRFLEGLKDITITWGSFCVFVVVEVALIYGLFKLTGVV
jgi:hypothetical protein